MVSEKHFLAVDLGAASGRIFVGSWNGKQFGLSELHRFANSPAKVLGHWHWDVLGLWSEISAGLSRYGRQHGPVIAGIGVDAWGIDFALLDSSGYLLGNPFGYRDSRTDGMTAAVFAEVSEQELFRETGNQSLQMNTLFQLFSMVKSQDPQLEAAYTMLMIPDLFAYWLCGEKAIEHTGATTTEMLCKGRMEWSHDLLRRLRIPSRMLTKMVPPGSVLASMRSQIANEAGLSPAPLVFAVAGHDTASAVAAIPGMDTESAFISSGTWSLIGVETNAPLTTRDAFRLGFSNEGGIAGSVLLLRIVAGLWLLQECMRQWRLQGDSYTWQGLIQMAEGAERFRSLIDPEAADFLAPVNMLSAICNFCQATNQPTPGTPAEFARCCMESLSLRYREILESLDHLTLRRLSVIRVVGGGSQNRLLCQLTADATGRVVIAGPVEAAALGNVMMQAVAAGEIANASEGRRILKGSLQQAVFEPRTSDAWEEAYSRFRNWDPTRKR